MAEPAFVEWLCRKVAARGAEQLAESWVRWTTQTAAAKAVLIWNAYGAAEVAPFQNEAGVPDLVRKVLLGQPELQGALLLGC